MDIKWKSKRIIRTVIVTIVLAAITAGNFAMFAKILTQVKTYREEQKEAGVSQDDLNDYMIQLLYYGTHKLYKEAGERQISEEAVYEDTMDTVVIGSGVDSNGGENVYYNMEHNENMENDFYSNFIYDGSLDYGVFQKTEKDGYELKDWHGDEVLLKEAVEFPDSAKEKYAFCTVLSFDEAGKMSVESVYDNKFRPEWIEEIFIDEEFRARRDYGSAAFPQNMKIVYAMTEENYFLENGNDYWDEIGAYYQNGAAMLPLISILLIIIFALFMRNPKLPEWKKESLLMRYPILPAALGIGAALSVIGHFPYIAYNFEEALEMIAVYKEDTYWLGYMISKSMMEVLVYTLYAVMLFLFYTMVYYAAALIRPVFSMGLKQYLQEKSITAILFFKIKSLYKKWKEELAKIHMEEPKKKKLFTLLFLNFIILSIISCFWFIGIPILLVYSMALYIYLQKCYTKAEKDYQVMSEAAQQLAGGNLEYQMDENMGLYEPMRETLGKVQEGIKTAVFEEVKSQKMKTELISNVSHDLKTPLTAITTYVELLKNPDLSNEERDEYIKTLEQKSLRLKTLIEDLFEVSKTASHDIVLEKTEVDIVNLLKQAAVEKQENWEKAGLTIRWNVPEEKIILHLDSQKTYRIFENLFGNITKYALSDTRVYVEVSQTEDRVQIVLRNISAVELTVSPDEIMERFVRGDASRNTEGSGLGLAIAKNLTEAQGGTMKIALDGDLFKVTIIWKRK